MTKPMQIDTTELEECAKTLNDPLQATIKAFDHIFETISDKNSALHGSEQTVFESNKEKYISMLITGHGHKFVLDHINDADHLLGEIFVIAINHTECDAGMYIKNKVLREIEKAAKPGVFEVKQAD